MSRFHRGHGAFQKPENALKRADELINVGQKSAALQALHDVVTSKRYRTWQKPLELIMFKYVDLCVEMKRGRTAKDGLIHYRNICQNVNVGSLGEVISYFLASALDKAEQAQTAADAVSLDIEDLEADASPEDLMLSYVSGERSKDRTDREMVMPWFKFLWETYRNVLDILRNNSRLEALYAQAASKAFQFCLKYKRNTEFRRLCDILRNHLANLGKYREQRDRPDLTIPESLQLYLDTRFEQLKVACELELWQEAFRSVEDIQALTLYSKKPIKREMMSVYYAKLTQIFTRSGNHLYNGYAWWRLFQQERLYNKKLTPSDLQTMSCCVVLSALSIPPYLKSKIMKSETDPEAEQDRMLRMAAIMGVNVDHKSDVKNLLRRDHLVAEVNNKAIMNNVSDDVRQLFTLLETEFNPLELCQKMAPLLEKLPSMNTTLSAASPHPEVDFVFFKGALECVAALKALHQLGDVYSVMKMTHLATLVPFMSFGQLEQMVVDGVKNGYLKAKLDHKNGTVHFGSLEIDSPVLSGQLAVLAKRLSTAVTMIQPSGRKIAADTKMQLIRKAVESSEKEHRRTLARKLIIERRKEDAERQLLEKEREAEWMKAQAERMTAEAEEKRREEERKKRELERIQRLLEEEEAKEKAQREEQEKKKGTRQELERKLQKMAKHMDHFERAKREEEEPMMREAYKKKLEDDAEYHRQEQERMLAAHKEAWEIDVKEKQRLSKMQEDKAVFQEQIMARRAEEFEALKRAHEERVAERRAQRKIERDLERKREYVKRCVKMIEEKRRQEAEEERRLEEEKRKRELAERERKLAELAELQRKKEEEIERRMREEKEMLLGRRPIEPAERVSAGGYVPPSKRGGDGYVPPFRRKVGAAAADLPPREETWARPAERLDSERHVPVAPEDSDKENPGAAYRPQHVNGDAAAPVEPESAPKPSAWKPARPSRDDGPPPPAEDKWGPPRDEYARRDDRGPPAGRSGGGYVPPNRRGAAPDGPPRGPDADRDRDYDRPSSFRRDGPPPRRDKW